MEKKKASLTLSSLAIVLIVAFIAVGIGVFNVNIAILLFLCWMIMWPFAAHLGYSFSGSDHPCGWHDDRVIYGCRNGSDHLSSRIETDYS